MFSQKSFNNISIALYVFFTATSISACAVTQIEAAPPKHTEFVAIASAPKTESKFYPVPIAPKGQTNFATELVNALGSPVGECDEKAKDTPHIDWTCAEYTYGLETFMESWDRREAAALLSKKYNYTPMSEWMYFEIDGEIDFFWKTYDLVDTQALVTYDPSEKGAELIVGLNSEIGSNIAASPGSHKFTSASTMLPIQE